MTDERSLGSTLPGLAEGMQGEFSLLELADRLLHRGVVISGEATISVAGVDLIYLGLNVVLTAVENLLPERDQRLARLPERSEGPATPADASPRSP